MIAPGLETASRSAESILSQSSSILVLLSSPALCMTGRFLLPLRKIDASVMVGEVKIWRSRRKLSQYLNGSGLLAPAVSLCVEVMVVEIQWEAEVAVVV